MPSIWVRLAIVGAVLLGIAASAIIHRASSPAYANGRVVEFDRLVAGPYEIAFGKIPPTPPVGNFYLSILLTDAVSKEPVRDAKVTVSAIGPPAEGETSPMVDGPEIGPIVVASDEDVESYPGYYDSDVFVLNRAGTWMFTVSVESAAGAASAEFPVDVKTPNLITGIITLVALIAFIIVVALAARMYIRERRRSKIS